MAEFLAMNGYGAYIWGAYGAGLLILGGLTVSSILKNKRLRGEIDRNKGKN